MICQELDIYLYNMIIDMDFLYRFNLGLIAPLFTGSFHEMFEKYLYFFLIFKSWQVFDWLAKWIIMLRYMDLSWPRVFPFQRRSCFCLWQAEIIICDKQLPLFPR